MRDRDRPLLKRDHAGADQDREGGAEDRDHDQGQGYDHAQLRVAAQAIFGIASAMELGQGCQIRDRIAGARRPEGVFERDHDRTVRVRERSANADRDRRLVRTSAPMVGTSSPGLTKSLTEISELTSLAQARRSEVPTESSVTPRSSSQRARASPKSRMLG